MKKIYVMLAFVLGSATTVFGQTAQIDTALNGLTAASMTDHIPVINAIGTETEYTYHVTDAASLNEFIIRSSANKGYITFAQVPGIKYNTVYSIEVDSKVGGFYQGYTASITYSTPAAAPASVLTTCGQTLTSLGQRIYANVVPGVNKYRFQVVGGGSSRSFDSTGNTFMLTQLSGTNLFGTVYAVSVATSSDGGATFGSYGSSCNVTTPAAPTQLKAKSRGITLTSYRSGAIGADIVTNATNYMFEITYLSTTYEYESSNYSMSLLAAHNATALPLAQSATYAIRVKAKVNGAYGAYATSYNVFTASNASRKGEFDTVADVTVKTFPNPFNGAFKFDFNSGSDENVSVNTYDMTGKLVETKEFSAVEMNNQEIGANYAAGIYNVTVKQGEFSKTLKVVKN